MNFNLKMQFSVRLLKMLVKFLNIKTQNIKTKTLLKKSLSLIVLSIVLHISYLFDNHEHLVFLHDVITYHIFQPTCFCNQSGIFLKEFLSEMDNFKQNSVQNSKKLSYKLPSKGKNVDHSPEAHSPVILLINIREQMYKIHEKSHEIDLIELNQLLDNASDTCQRRCDLNQVAQFTSCRLFYDMFFMLASKRPELACDQDYIVKLVEFWDKFLHKSEKIFFFDRILCPRNACIFEHSGDPRNTWLACELLIKELFNKELLKLEQFEKQTIAMFRYEWSSNTIKLFTQCLQNVIDEYVRKNGTQENFTFILQWIADYCNDDEFF